MNDYCFVDGGYVRRVYRKTMQTLFQEDGELDVRFLKGIAQRVFYYDCEPARKEGETEESFELRYQDARRIFNDVRRLDGFHLRLGQLTGKTKQRQKQVDVRLAVDMLNHAYRKNMESATLFAGDQDFAPIIDSLIQNGTYVRVAFERRSGSRTLYRLADMAVELTMNVIYFWSSERFRRDHHLPTELQNQSRPQEVPGCEIIKRGTCDGAEITVYRQKVGTDFTHSLYREGGALNPLCMRYQNLEVLLVYFQNRFGQISWD
jgi:uncharacterized LabA/DUF88 family protein